MASGTTTNKQLADALFVSEHTIRGHVSNILEKLGVTNRTHALVRAVVLGLVTIGE